MQRNRYAGKKILFCIVAVFIVLIVLTGLVFLKKLPLNQLWIGAYDVRGVDISHYQGTVDMREIEQQDMKFIFIKATEGSSNVDEKFYENWGNASKTKLYTGAYHFFSFDSPGKKQAENYIATVGNLAGKLIPVVDVEYYGNKEKNPPDKKDVSENLTTFLSELEEEYGVKPMIYTTYKVYYRYIKDRFTEYPLWIRNVYYKPNGDLGRQWDFWQYSDTARLEGYNGREKYIDCNVFYGLPEQLSGYVVPKS